MPVILFPFGKILAILSSSLGNLDSQRDFDESMLFACKIEAFIGLPQWSIFTVILKYRSLVTYADIFKNLNHTRSIINNSFQT